MSVYWGRGTGSNTEREPTESVSAVQRRACVSLCTGCQGDPGSCVSVTACIRTFQRLSTTFRVKLQLFLYGLTIPTTSTASSPDPPTSSMLGSNHMRYPHLTNTPASQVFAHTAPLPGEQSPPPEANCYSAFKCSSRASTEPSPTCRLSPLACVPYTSVAPHWPTARRGLGCDPTSVGFQILSCGDLNVRK